MNINVFKKAESAVEPAQPVHELEMAKNRLILGLFTWAASYMLGADAFIFVAFACFLSLHTALFIADKSKSLQKESCAPPDSQLS